MTIESEFNRMANALERIATTLEKEVNTSLAINNEINTHFANTAAAQSLAAQNVKADASLLVDEVETATAEVADAIKKKGRSTVPKKVQPQQEPDTVKPLTINDVRAALTKLQNSKGLSVAKGILDKFGVKALSAISAECYADVIKAANAA